VSPLSRGAIVWLISLLAVIATGSAHLLDADDSADAVASDVQDAIAAGAEAVSQARIDMRAPQ
jgi:hypothetical protein